MLKIGICDDDHAQIEQIHNWIDAELFWRTDLSIVHFASGEEVVSAIEKEQFDVHLLFMDIHMKKLSGMDTAAYIRQHHIDVDIIFLTVSKHDVYNGYMHKAYAYLLKPVQRETFTKVLNQYVDEWQQGTGYLEVKTSGGLVKLWLSKVLYFTSDVRVIEAHLAHDVVRFYGRLDELERQISGSRFLRCHQSFLVNRDRIEKLTREWLLLHGERIPVSRSRYEQMKQQGMFDKEGKSVEHVRHRSLSEQWKDVGAVIGISGKYLGVILRMKGGQRFVIGRNYEQSDLVVDDGCISRSHCWIEYHPAEKNYYVCDQSANGVFINDSYYLERDRVVILKPGDELRLADTEHVFKLG